MENSLIIKQTPKLSISFVDNINSKSTYVFIDEARKLYFSSANSKVFSNEIINALESSKNIFEPKYGTFKALTFFSKEGDLEEHVIMVGLGQIAKLTHPKIEMLGAKIFKHANKSKFPTASVYIDLDLDITTTYLEAICLLAQGAQISSYSFDKYKNFENLEINVTKNLEFWTADHNLAHNRFHEHAALVQAIHMSRNAINEPPNVLFPQSYATAICNAFEDLDVKISILDENKMQELGMGALLGVGRGSRYESKMVVIEYYGDEKHPNAQPIALVGKGVTFDTGGICLKPSHSVKDMKEMKYDMTGSAVVFGVAYALAARKAKVNFIAIGGLVENMIGSNAQRPSDVVKSMSGKTIEIADTDAEGRLVLADAMTYVQTYHKPKAIIDVATLTGAISVALGSTFAGCFSNNDTLADNLHQAGLKSGESIWRMPIHEDYAQMIKSDIADLTNLPNEARLAGSSVAAQFLYSFIENDLPWAHLDIAGVGMSYKGGPLCPKGSGTAFGIKLLHQFVKDYHEAK